MKTFLLAGILTATGFLAQHNANAQYRRNDRNRYENHQRYDQRRDYGYAYRRPVPRYSVPRYYGARPGVSVVANLPFGSVSVHLGATPYHYYRGTFYRPYGPRFMVAAPPVGIIVPVLPPDCSEVLWNGQRCYYYSGTYYQPLGLNEGYRVMESGATAQQENSDSDNNDPEFEKVVIEGKTYYKKDDTYYKAVISGSGEVTYEAVSETGK